MSAKTYHSLQIVKSGYPFTGLLHISVSLKVLCYLGIPGEMSMADIVGADDTRQLSGCLKYQAVIEHLYLNLCPLDISSVLPIIFAITCVFKVLQI